MSGAYDTPCGDPTCEACEQYVEALAEYEAEVARSSSLDAEGAFWRDLAIHALHDLRLCGIPIEKIRLVAGRPSIVALIDHYDRSMESFS